MTSVLEIYLQGPGKSWNLLGSDVDGSFWLQIDMFLRTKTAIIVAAHQVGLLECRYDKNAFPPEALPPTPMGELTALSHTP